MPSLQSILDAVLLCLVVAALGGAFDYITGSVRIFRDALRRYRERRGDDGE